MAEPTNYYKLGLFVIVGSCVALAAAIFFGGARLRKQVVECHSYFNESVQGLEIGAPVEFRGVTVGHVGAIEIAPDHRMVDVVSELDPEAVEKMGLTAPKHTDHAFVIPPDLRMQLNSQGITGVKFVSIDFFDVDANPPPKLPFQVPQGRYIPAASSMMKNLEDTINKAMDRLPEMVDAVVLMVSRVDGLIAALAEQDLSGKASKALTYAEVVMRRLERTVARIDESDLGPKSAATLAELNVAATKLNTVLDELSGSSGLITSARRATETIRDVGHAGFDLQGQLDSTLQTITEAADAVRTLVESLEREPDMLLKGKSSRKGRDESQTRP